MRMTSWRRALTLGMTCIMSAVAGCLPAASAGSGDASTELTCTIPAGSAQSFASSRLYIEHNFTDQDTGVHGLLGAEGNSETCIYDPNGQLIYVLKPQGNLGRLGIADSFFESREPEESEVGFGLDDILALFPEGQYTIRGTSAVDGTPLEGTAMFTHDIPAAPVITQPEEDAVVSPTDLIVEWEPVTRTLRGTGVEILAYEVIITEEVPAHPHAFARATLDVHVPSTSSRFAVPAEFLKPGAEYELEVLAIEASGNQTIAIVFFETAGTP